MLVVRITWIVKPAKVNEFSDLVKEVRDQIDRPNAIRIYKSNIGPSNKVTFEMEFESLAEYESWFKDWQTTPEAQVFSNRGQPIRESVAIFEILDLVE